MPGYHVRTIERGVVGELSKIREELDEAIDAEEQGCNIMVLVELSDVVGAIEEYLARHYPATHLVDLIKMSDITRRAFREGFRK